VRHATGNVEVMRGTETLCRATLSPTGTAAIAAARCSLPPAMLGLGTTTVRALYLGSGISSPSQSAPRTLKVTR
jgi:hypothetical protein